MIYILSGTSHTGKTLFAQKLLEKYQYPYLSIDHLKMGLIRSGQTTLTPEDDAKLTEYLWPIVCEIIKTAIENKQNLIVEGCYIPYAYKKDFTEKYLPHINVCWLVFSEQYIEKYYDEIIKNRNVIEHRGPDLISKSQMIANNKETLEQCEKHGGVYHLIDQAYDVSVDMDI
ncbi:MAG: adenylate kinase, partial [Bacilli bacterium]